MTQTSKKKKNKKKRTKKGDIKKKGRKDRKNTSEKCRGQIFRVIMIMTGMTKTYKKVKEKKQTIRGEIVI